MSILQHHDAITGSDAQFVADDYAFTLQSAMESSNKQYKKILIESLKKNTGIQASKVESCAGSQNNTVLECPIYENKNDQRSDCRWAQMGTKTTGIGYYPDLGPT